MIFSNFCPKREVPILPQRIPKIRIDIRTSEMVTGPLPAWLGLFNQVTPMCQDAGNIMVALNPFAYGEGNLKDFRYIDGRWMGHVGGSDWRHWIVFSFPGTPDFFAHDSYTMVKNLLLLADVTRLLKVGSLHGQNTNNKGWCDFVASVNVPRLAFGLRCVGHFYGLYYVLILLVY